MLNTLDAKINQGESVKYFDEVLFSLSSLHFNFETISERLITEWFESSLVDPGVLSVILHHLTDPLKFLPQITDEQLFAYLSDRTHEKYYLIHQSKTHCSCHLFEAFYDQLRSAIVLVVMVQVKVLNGR